MKHTISFLIAIVFTVSSYSQKIIQWRGEDRTGIYDETGLLKKWPEKGPELLWHIESLPKGYSSVAISDNKMYLTGIKGKQDIAIAMDMKGKILWEKAYGRAWDRSYSDSRATPTIEGNRLYVSSGLGDISCLNTKNGDIIWSIKASEKYEGDCGYFGISESLLIVDNKVIYSPGGNETAVVAFDKITGKEIWKSKTLNDKTGYASPLLINRGGKKLIVNAFSDNIFAVNADNGDILWKYDFAKLASKRKNSTNTPLYHNGELFVTSGYDRKCVMLSISEDGNSVKEKWTSDALDVHHGGVVHINNHIYGANWKNNSTGNWVCLDWNTGEVKYETKWQNKGSIISADGMMYCYEEKRGHIALVKPNPEKFDIVSFFKVPYGKGPHWAHPVIFNKVLYIRHANALMAYDISDN